MSVGKGRRESEHWVQRVVVGVVGRMRVVVVGGVQKSAGMVVRRGKVLGQQTRRLHVHDQHGQLRAQQRQLSVQLGCHGVQQLSLLLLRLAL